MFSAVLRRQMAEHDGRAWLAWHIAALPYVKPFPDLSALLSSAPAKAAPAAQTPEEQLAIALAWTAALQTAPQS